MIKEKEYRQRRDLLARKLSKNTMAVVFSATHKVRSNDTEFPFRQNSNFYYLTGFIEDNAILVLVKNKTKYKSILFVHKKDKIQELWNGKRLGTTQAKKHFLVDEVYTSDEFESIFNTHASLYSKLYFDFKTDSPFVDPLKRDFKKFSQYENLAPFVESMRLIKSSAEIDLIKKALQITKDAHHSLMKQNKNDKYEYELQADIEHTFKKNSAFSDAYTSIVAGGNNANTLHYINNNQKLKSQELILIDAGCEYQYYASDITRTIPVNGRFSSEQKEVYDLVLNTQLEVLKAIKIGVKRSKLQKIAINHITKGLVELGVLHGDVKKLIKKEKYKPYYPHGIGHWMGIDVHDECPYLDKKSKELVLKKGMVLTIEPGIYLDKEDKKVPEKYRGIAIRIEDDILITDKGYENLSIEIVKTTQAIESLNLKEI